MMSEERLQEIWEQIHNKISPWPYQALVVRGSPQERLDIVSGPKIDLAEAQRRHEEAKLGGRPILIQQVLTHEHRHVVHIHFINGPWFEQNPNMVEDGKFFEKAPEIVNELLLEIKRLKSGS